MGNAHISARGINMRWLITLLIGVVGGFVLGAFTPASDYFSVDKLSGLISQEANSENEAEGTPELSIYERIDGAIAVVRDSAKDTVETVDQFGSILGQEAPGDWTMAHADVTRSPNSITQASIESGDANVPPEVAELVAMLNEAIREFKAHNEQLTADIETSDKGHPQHFYLKTLLHSNLSMITYSEYLIAVQAGDFTIQGLAQLQVSLDESKKEIENSSTDGTKASANWAAINKIMPAKSDGDRAVKALVNQFFRLTRVHLQMRRRSRPN